MLKKILIGLITITLLVGYKKAIADSLSLSDYLKKLPALNQSIIFSLTDNKFDYATSVTLAQVWKERISFDIGYSPTVEALGLVSIKLIEVKDYIKFPILDLMVIEPGFYLGTKRIENFKNFGEYDWGLVCKLISLKF